MSQRQVCAAAGLSKHQEKQAKRVANIPDDEFEALVESEHPPTVTALAELGTQHKPSRVRASAIAQSRARRWPTVRDALIAFDAEAFPSIVRQRVAEHAGTLLDRYRRLVERVWLQLPEGWDSHTAHWEVIAGEIPSECGEAHLAGARVEPSDDDEGQRWIVVLVVAELDGLGDDDVARVIAHELAHVATGLPTDERQRNTDLCEDRADHLMRLWGFEPRLDVEGGA